MTEACACGMFAVGLCSSCGAPRCGAHSGFLAGKFVCDTHIAEAAREEAERHAEEKRRLNEVAARQRQERELGEQQRSERFTPGFPENDACSGPDMSTALARLVASHSSTYIIGYHRISPKINYRHWGPAILTEGWGFATGRRSFESNFARGYHGVGLIVTREGTCYRTEDLNVRGGEQVPRPKISREMYDKRERMSDDWLIPAGDVQAIREQVLVWRDA